MSTNQTPADRLDDGYRCPEDIINLMTPPGGDIGFATPLHYDSSLETDSENTCISGVVEFRGVIVFTYLTQSGEWVMSETMLGDVDAFFSVSSKGDRFIETITKEIQAEHGNEIDTYSQPITSCRTPPGYTSRFVIPHKPLNIETIEKTSEQQNGYVENIIPRYSSPTVDDKVISVISIEDEELATNEYHVFMYYVSEFETWRVLDATNEMADDPVVERIHKDLTNKVVEQYGEYNTESKETLRNTNDNKAGRLQMGVEDN